MENNKQKLVAGLLAIFLGVYGVHNFYLGSSGAHPKATAASSTVAVVWANS